MANIPKDPVMLLSFLNTQLRDYYPSLEDCCLSLGINMEEITGGLALIGYYYNEEKKSVYLIGRIEHENVCKKMIWDLP